MKMSLSGMLKTFPECMPNCCCANKYGSDYAQFKVRLHMAQPTGDVIQAVDATCDCCGRTAYVPIAHRKLTRADIEL